MALPRIVAVEGDTGDETFDVSGAGVDTEEEMVVATAIATEEDMVMDEIMEAETITEEEALISQPGNKLQSVALDLCTAA